MPHSEEALQFGLKPAVINSMNAVFMDYPAVEQVILYGSRAKGTYKRGSDIDLCLIGEELTMPILLKIDNALDDLLLPYKIDLSIHAHIDNDDLLSHIERIGTILYRRGDITNKEHE